MNKVDINCASAEQLVTLIGIGHCKAGAIIQAREGLRGFSSLHELATVAGVGRKVVNVNRSRLVCRKMKSAASKSLPSRPRTSRSSQRHTCATKPCTATQPDPRHTSDPSSARDTPTSSSPRQRTPRHRQLLMSRRSKLHAMPAVSKRHTRSMCAERSSATRGLDTPNDSRIDDDSSADGSVFASGHASRDDLASDNAANGDRSADRGCRNCTLSSTSSQPAAAPPVSRPSRIPVPVDVPTLSLYQRKRKCDLHHPSKSMTPGKRPCRTKDNSILQRGGPLFLSLYGVTNIQWRKIPSKDNPPAHHNEWLQTFQEWSNAERLMALDNLISLCEPTQVRHMMQVIEPQFQRDFISLLPKELALYVLSYLEPRDLLRAAQTCHYWRILAEDKLLWREKCAEEQITDGLVYGSRHAHRRHRASSTCTSPWKALYLRQHHIEHNWRSGDIRSPKVLKGHDDHVITCLEFSGARIVSGSDDNTLKVWSVVNGKCLRTLVGHTGGVWSSQMQGNTIISGSTDRTLKVWNADSGQCVYTLYGHTSTVRCMHLHDNRVVSGSRDATLRMWDIDTGQCLHVLMGHVAAVRCVQYDGHRVVSGAYDFTVKVWDPELETCLHTLQGHTNRVYSLQFDGAHIVSGSLDTSIRVWDVDTGNCLHTLIGHQSLTSGMELKDNILVSGNADSTVKVWDIRTGQCLQTLQGPNKHQSAVTCLFQFNKTFVITSSDDGTVKIWDLRTGDFLRNLVTLESGGSGGVVWRVRCSNTKLVCAVGSRNGTEETKLLVLDFDVADKKLS